MKVVLTSEEMIEFGTAGITRTALAMAKKRGGAHGFNRHAERWQIDVEGLLSEAAAAKALGLPYTPTVGQLDTADGDIAPDVQVRSTKYGTGSLLIHDSDIDHHAFILVTGVYGAYDLRGWVYASEGKDPTLWKVYKNRGAYWVPQERLRPMDTLLPAMGLA